MRQGELWKQELCIFFSSYCCNGMNFYDVALLKYKNIQGHIDIVRHKTKNTTTNGGKGKSKFLRA